MSFSKIVSITAAMASVASGHIIMTNPVPFGGINNSPLNKDGSDFPCKAVAYNAAGISNVYEQGSTQTLSFKGTAVHGGGSCQVSVTTDLNPTRDSVWKVIESIEGGCPARDTPLNIGNDAEAPVPFTYDFGIPSELAAGEYVLAWSWFNKIGDREMYMNCAPISVTGSGGSTDFLNALPDMFTANIGNGCGTTEGTDLQFPNPGASSQEGNTSPAGNNFGPPTGSCAAASGPVNPPSQGAPVENAPSEPAPAPPAPAPVEPAPAPAPPAPAPPSGGNGGSAGGACSPDGDFLCIGGSSFSQCANGIWSVAQPVAPGTTCVAGQGSTLSLAKRGARGFTRRSLPVRA